MKNIILLIVFTFSFSASGQSSKTEGWSLFARVTFISKLFKEQNEYFLVPQFDSKLKQLQGNEIELKGYYIPFDLSGPSIVLSKNPFSACFFCGSAGPETVAEINFKNKPPRLKADQLITVKGKLRLNDKDVEHLTFILDQAELITNNK